VNLSFKFLLTPLLLSAFFVGSGLLVLYQWWEQINWYWLIITILVGITSIYSVYRQFTLTASAAIFIIACAPILNYYHHERAAQELNLFIKDQGDLHWVQGVVTHSYPVATNAKLKRYKLIAQHLLSHSNKNLNSQDKGRIHTMVQPSPTFDVPIFLSLPAQSKPLKIGDTISYLASIKTINKATSPFDFDFKRYAHSQGVKHQTQALSPITLIEGSLSPLLQFKARLYHYRAWVKDRLSLGIDNNSAAYQLMLPLVLGIKNADTQAALEPFKYLGLLHLFAISGLHLGLMLYLVNRLTLLAKVPYKFRYLIIFSVLLYYTLITGWAPSIMRTSIFLLIWGLSKVGRLAFRPLNALCATFILSLCINPYQLFQMGFQLSFSIVLALLCLGKLWETYAKNWAKPDAYLPVKFWKHHQRIKFIGGQKLGQTFAVSLFAFVASMGFMFYYFGAAYWWSILLTPFFIPLISGEIIITLLLLVAIPIQNDYLQTHINKAHLWYLQKLHLSAQKLEEWLPNTEITVSNYNKPSLWFITTGFDDHLVCVEQNHLHLFPQSSASLRSILQLQQKMSLKLPHLSLANRTTIHLKSNQNPYQLSQMPGMVSRKDNYLSLDNLSFIRQAHTLAIPAIEIQHLHQPIKILYLAKINNLLEVHDTYVDQIKKNSYQTIVIHPSWNKLYPEFIVKLKLIHSTIIIEQSIHGAIKIIANKQHYQLSSFLSGQTWGL